MVAIRKIHTVLQSNFSTVWLLVSFILRCMYRFRVIHRPIHWLESVSLRGTLIVDKWCQAVSHNRWLLHLPFHCLLYFFILSFSYTWIMASHKYFCTLQCASFFTSLNGCLACLIDLTNSLIWKCFPTDATLSPHSSLKQCWQQLSALVYIKNWDVERRHKYDVLELWWEYGQCWKLVSQVWPSQS
jgi:hypothetical protein